MPSTAGRLLDLLALLQTRRQWSGADLADRLGVAARTVRRDVERLRDLGYPVESDRGVAGGYRLGAGASLPPLLLDDEEATAIAVGLRTATGTSVSGIEDASLRALLKLEQVLPRRLRPRVAALSAATTIVPLPGPRVDSDVLSALAMACRESESLRFDYRRRDGEERRRRVEPHALVNPGRRWYLVAWDIDRDDWRTFRVDRMAAPRATGHTFVPREVPTGDPAAFVAGGLHKAHRGYEARVILHAPAELAEERAPFHWGEITPIDAETCEYRTGDDDLRWLAIRLIMFGVDFEVLEPPALVDYLDELAGRLSSPSR